MEKGMEEIIIYRFQLEKIREALRLTSNIHESQKGETCFDRQVRQAKKYAENALEGKKDEQVRYIYKWKEKQVKTTKLVDQAIQIIFTSGSLRILRPSEISDPDKKWIRGMKQEDIVNSINVVDFDGNNFNNNMFQYFYDKLIERLKSEHEGYFEVRGNKIIAINQK